VHAYRVGGPESRKVAILFSDITERKRAERELEEKHNELNAAFSELTAVQEELNQNFEELAKSEAIVRDTSQYLENLINYANAPIIVWNPQFRITRFNHAFEYLTGRNADEVIGKTLDTLFPDNLREQQMTIIQRTLEGERWEGVEILIRHVSGEVRTVLWNSATLYAADGMTVSSVIAQGQDISLRKLAETDLVRKNEELTAVQEELRQNVDELAASELMLRANETELKETIAEKDILLAEIHHRVKNNLTALISLLSLEGGYEETPEGQALKKDLQNRARSMALIHETLYRTKKYAEVDMGVYLNNLVDQMQLSLTSSVPVRTVIEASDVMLDIPRATPCGLILNELVTNSFKYAFPPTFDCMQERNAPPTISIALARNDGSYNLTYRDNGIGLPEGFDAKTAQSLGLKLVNFLAKHQMRATVDVGRQDGTEFTFRFKENGR
jgi:PAS domain S-box-containing protein